jgi:RHS repeat-associated protein
VRYTSGSLPTKYTFTGQYSEDYIKLLWYNSRWYDSELGRFTQPDSIVPGVGENGNPNAIGYLGATTYTPLIVDFHETQFLEQVNREYRVRLQTPNFKLPPIPANSVAFDRYAYSFNNPTRYTDPTGHCPFCLALAAVPVGGWVALGIATTAVVVYFAVPGVREAVTEGIYQAGETAANGLNAVFSRPQNNQAQNKQFRGAVQQLERELGRKLTQDEIQALHNALHELEDPGFWDIVEEGHKMLDQDDEND